MRCARLMHAFLVVASLALCACTTGLGITPSRFGAVDFYAYTSEEFEPTHADSIVVVHQAESGDPDRSHTQLGMFSYRCKRCPSEYRIMRQFRSAAATLGAHAILIEEPRKEHVTDQMGGETVTVYTAIAIRYDREGN